jgi:hypothetical protein
MAECILLEQGGTRHLLLHCSKKAPQRCFHHCGAILTQPYQALMVSA